MNKTVCKISFADVARSAARYAEWSVASSAEFSAARSVMSAMLAELSAVEAAAWAAEAAAEAADANAAWKQEADDLLEILSSLKGV